VDVIDRQPPGLGEGGDEQHGVKSAAEHLAADGLQCGDFPLAGQRATCPVDAQTEVALASPGRAISALLRAAGSSDQAWGDRTAVNMPALTLTVAKMIAALERVAGPEASALIDWAPDPAVAAIVTSWPARFRADRAARLGLAPDPDYDAVIRTHLAETQRP